MPKYQALFSFISPESHLSHILAGFFVTNQPGEIKTRQTNQETKENQSRKVRHFILHTKRVQTESFLPQIGEEVYLKITFVFSMVPQEMGYSEITYQDPFSVVVFFVFFPPKKATSSVEECLPMVYKSLPGGTIQIHLKLTFMFKNTTSFIFTAELCDQCQGL